MTNESKNQKSNVAGLVVLVVILMTLSLFVGCEGTVTVSDGDVASSSSAIDFSGRLEAGMAITDNSVRDTALAELARDAASAGETSVVKNAIDAIGSIELHDSASAEAAGLLSANGKSAEASSVAKQIRDNSLRDKTLAVIAKGD